MDTALQQMKDLVKKPPIIAIVACVLLLFLGVRLPGVAMTTAEYISGSVAPLALIYTGYVTFELGLRNLSLERGLPTLTVMRLAVAPLICFSLCALAGVEGLSRDVFVMQSGLPVFTQGPVLAGTYGADDQYAASAVVLTTIGAVRAMLFLLALCVAGALAGKLYLDHNNGGGGQNSSRPASPPSR